MPTPSIADTYISIPELMRVARGSYKRAVDQQLATDGFEDLPTASGYLLAYIVNGEDSIPEMIEGLGFRKREFSRLVDTLVLRGYLTRSPAQENRVDSLTLTDRGHAAFQATQQAANRVDEELERQLTDDELAGLRRGLAVLGEIKRSLPGPAIRRGLPPADD